MIKPNLRHRFGDYHLLWFQQSNTYSCVSSDFYQTLDVFFSVTTKADFVSCLVAELGISTQLAESQYSIIETYLTGCNTPLEHETQFSIPSKRTDGISTFYTLKGQLLELRVSHPKLKERIHPLLAHLEVANVKQSFSDLCLNIEQIDQHLVLRVSDGSSYSYPSQDYHKLQGKAMMHILNLLHRCTEDQWMGFLHASAVSKNKNGLVFIGSSGSGKSTLVSLLAAKGFRLLADDLVPIKSEDRKIYANPGAVSIKAGNLEFILEFWPDNQHYQGSINKGKGTVTYIPMQADLIERGTDCKALIKVNYKKNSTTSLKPLDLKGLLDVLIPESWLHPGQDSAKSFMSWLSQIDFFELTYSNYEEVIPLMVKLTE